LPEISLQELVDFDLKPLPRVVAGSGDYDVCCFVDLMVGCGRRLFFHDGHFPL